MRFWWFGLVVLVGCVKPQDVACSSGAICPAGYTCITNGCASPDQLKACEGHGDGDMCTANGTPGGCMDGACLVTVCGNNRIEPGEVCDDGNLVSGDGCNSRCSSDETCGNGVVELDEECDSGANCGPTCKFERCGNGLMDPGEVCDDGNILGNDGCGPACDSNETCGNGKVDIFKLQPEQCDDSNHRLQDGCNDQCELEKFDWTANDPNYLAPAPNEEIAAAYDTERRRLVVFGGYTTDPIGKSETWELEGPSWVKRVLQKSPNARWGAAMAYDWRRGVMVMYGGVSNGLYDNLTWEYDGLTWRSVSTANRPPGRQGHQLVYDSARKRVVMFGGFSSDPTNHFLNDTWEYDGTGWTNTVADSSLTNPVQRQKFGLAYDPKRGRVILYGGLAGATALGDTWQYDGTAWTTVSGTAVTPARSNAAMAFDPVRGAIVMSGGKDASNTLLDETWTLGGSGWTSLGATPGHSGHVAAFDSATGKSMIYGGYDAANSDAPTVRELTSTTWADVVITPTPPAHDQLAAAFDTTRGELFVFLGKKSDGIGTYYMYAVGETGQRIVRTPTTTIPNLESPAMAYDASRRVLVLFGGHNATTDTMTNETYEYDGTDWVHRTPTTKPPARWDHRMVFDVATRRILMFGGRDFTGNTGPSYYNDTWAWDPAGNTWTNLNPTTKPTARSGFAMAYDTARARTVLWGGASDVASGGANSDTYFFDGTNWSSMTSLLPPYTLDSSMAYDSARDRMVMQGGGGGGNPTTDTWELRAGNTWVQVANSPTDVRGPGVAEAMLAFDPAHGHVVLFGGATPTPPTTIAFTYGAQPTKVPGCHSGHDYDGDNLVGCADDDCWGVCTPLCPPGSTNPGCVMVARCGDGTCDPVENCRNCPADCPLGGSACPVLCGDGFCDSAESAVTCPGDCP